MFESSHIELSSSALVNNLKFIRKQIKPGVRMCSVVKGNAYGHGLTEFVNMSMNAGVDYFAVHSAEEAYKLKNSLEKMPEIFIMGAAEDEAVEWAIENNIEFSVFDFKRLIDALFYAKKLRKKALVHVEAETGMLRTGFARGQLADLCDWLNSNREHIVFQGLFTHFAGAESRANHFRITGQISSFDEISRTMETAGLKPKYQHSACSAALLNYPETQGNMVRLGILQYGYWPNKETHIRYTGENDKMPDRLKRIIRWTTKVMSIKEVSKGNFVGYGTSYLAHANMRLAVIPIGYSHGYNRSLSNLGSVLINGRPAPVVGIVNMNSLTVDITHAGNVEKGDEVVLIGKQKGKVITVNSFSEQSNQLNYEMLTRIPHNIPRIVTD